MIRRKLQRAWKATLESRLELRSGMSQLLAPEVVVMAV